MESAHAMIGFPNNPVSRKNARQGTVIPMPGESV